MRSKLSQSLALHLAYFPYSTRSLYCISNTATWLARFNNFFSQKIKLSKNTETFSLRIVNKEYENLLRESLGSAKRTPVETQRLIKRQ